MILEMPRYIENESSLEEEEVKDPLVINKRGKFHTKDKKDYSLLTATLAEEAKNGK